MPSPTFIVPTISYFVDGPEPEEVLDIAVYYDRLYLNSIETELNNYNSNRISSTNK